MPNSAKADEAEEGADASVGDDGQAGGDMHWREQLRIITHEGSRRKQAESAAFWALVSGGRGPAAAEQLVHQACAGLLAGYADPVVAHRAANPHHIDETDEALTARVSALAAGAAAEAVASGYPRPPLTGTEAGDGAPLDIASPTLPDQSSLSEGQRAALSGLPSGAQELLLRAAAEWTCQLETGVSSPQHLLEEDVVRVAVSTPTAGNDWLDMFHSLFWLRYAYREPDPTSNLAVGHTGAAWYGRHNHRSRKQLVFAGSIEEYEKRQEMLRRGREDKQEVEARAFSGLALLFERAEADEAGGY